MQFYKITCYKELDEQTIGEWSNHDHHRRRDARLISGWCEEYSEKLNEVGYFFFSDTISDQGLVFGLILRKTIDIKAFIESFLKIYKLDTKETCIKETTLRKFRGMMSDAMHRDYIDDEDAINNSFGLENVPGFIDETVIKDNSKEAIYLAADSYFTRNSFKKELDRIFKDKKRKSGIILHHMVLEE